MAQPVSARRTRFLRSLRRAAVWLVCGYLLILGIVWYTQEQLIFPGSFLSRGRQPKAGVRGSQLVELKTEGGEKLPGLFLPAYDGDRPVRQTRSRPTLLYFYGNGGTLATVSEELQQMQGLGVNVFCPEYPGFGVGEGGPSEAGCYAAARAAWAHVVSRRDVDPRRIVAGGWSLGGAVAIYTAANRPVAGLVSMSTFSSLTEMASLQYPYLPVGLLLRHRFENMALIRRTRCPVFLAHGDADPLVPSAMLRRLAARAPGPVTCLEVKDAGHGDLLWKASDDFWTGLKRFLNEARAAS